MTAIILLAFSAFLRMAMLCVQSGYPPTAVIQRVDLQFHNTLCIGMQPTIRNFKNNISNLPCTMFIPSTPCMFLIRLRLTNSAYFWNIRVWIRGYINHILSGSEPLLPLFQIGNLKFVLRGWAAGILMTCSDILGYVLFISNFRIGTRLNFQKMFHVSSGVRVIIKFCIKSSFTMLLG